VFYQNGPQLAQRALVSPVQQDTLVMLLYQHLAGLVNTQSEVKKRAPRSRITSSVIRPQHQLHAMVPQLLTWHVQNTAHQGSYVVRPQKLYPRALIVRLLHLITSGMIRPKPPARLWHLLVLLFHLKNGRQSHALATPTRLQMRLEVPANLLHKWKNFQIMEQSEPHVMGVSNSLEQEQLFVWMHLMATTLQRPRKQQRESPGL
jgi:hypothetical protein